MPGVSESAQLGAGTHSTIRLAVVACAPEETVDGLYAWSRRCGVALIFCHSAIEAVQSARQDARIVLVALGDLPDAPASRVIEAFRRFPTPPHILRLSEPDRASLGSLPPDTGSPHTVSLSGRALAAALDRVCMRGQVRSEVLEFEPVRIDLIRRQLSVDGAVRPLSKKRFDLLAHLASNAGRCVSSDELHLQVVGKFKGDPYRIPKDVKAVRYALGRAWRMIRTSKQGGGYQFDPKARLDEPPAALPLPAP